MPQVALGLAGQIAFGAAFGTSATFLGVSAATWGGLAGSLLGGALFPTTTPGQSPSEINVSGASHGSPIPWIMGVRRVGMEMIDVGEPLYAADSVKVGPGSNAEIPKVYLTFAMRLCEGPIDALLRLWADKEVILDLRSSNTGPVTKSAFRYRVYYGTEEQEPDPWMIAEYGAANVGANRGVAYVVFEDFPLHDHGFRVPQFEAEVAVNGSASNAKELLNPLVTTPNEGAQDFAVFVYRDPYEPFTYVLTGSGFNSEVIAKFNTITGDLVGYCEPFLTTGSSSYEAPPIRPPNSDYLFAMHQGAFFARFAVINKDTMQLHSLIGPSSSTPLRADTQFTHLDATPNGDIVVAIGTSPVFGDGEIMAGYVPTGAFAVAQHSELNDSDRPPNPARAVCFDDAGVMWLSTTAGELVEYIIWSDGTTIGLEKIAIYQPTAETDPINDIVYSPATREFLLWYENGKFVRWSKDTHTASSAVVDVTYTGWQVFPANQNVWRSDKHGMNDDLFFGHVLEGGVDQLILFDANNLTETSYSANNWSISSATPGPLVFDHLTQCFWRAMAAGSGLYRLFLDRYEADTITLEDFMEAIADRVSIEPAQRDFTDLASVDIIGTLVDAQTQARSVVSATMTDYFFDMIDTGNLVKGQLRGGAPVMTISEDDLAAAPGTQGFGQRMKITREPDEEIPRFVDFVYPDVDRDYLSDNQPSARPDETQFSSNQYTLHSSTVRDKDDAATAARRWLAERWTRAAKYDFALPIDYLRLEAADPILLQFNGWQFEATIQRRRFGEEFTLPMEALGSDSGVYSITAPGATDGNFTPGEIEIIAPPELLYADTALLRLTDDVPGSYVTAGPLIPGFAWNGAVIQKSTDGTTWATVASVGDAASWGHALSVLPTNPYWTIWDEDNTISVRMINGTFTSATDEEVEDDLSLNLILLGQELIQFRTAVQVDDDEWELSGLLRARFGTEAHIGDHALGEKLIVIDAATLRTQEYPAAELDATRYYRALNASVVGSSDVETIEQTTRRLMPYAPYLFEVTRDGSNNITGDFQRRSRSPGASLITSPLFEATADYEIDVLDSMGDVVRTLTTTLSANGSGITSATARTFYYDADDQVLDFGTTQPALDIEGYQLNAIRGRGYAGAATI